MKKAVKKSKTTLTIGNNSVDFVANVVCEKCGGLEWYYANKYFKGETVNKDNECGCGKDAYRKVLALRVEV